MKNLGMLPVLGFCALFSIMLGLLVIFSPLAPAFSKIIRLIPHKEGDNMQ
jgi:hypothetical protein